MNNLIAQIALVFVSVYVLGDVFQATHFENVVFAAFMTLGFSIYYNAHKILWEKLRHAQKNN